MQLADKYAEECTCWERDGNGEGTESICGGAEAGEAFAKGLEALLRQIRPRELRQLP